jgi:hypothetical protein
MSSISAVDLRRDHSMVLFDQARIGNHSEGPCLLVLSAQALPSVTAVPGIFCRSRQGDGAEHQQVVGSLPTS